MLLIVKHMGGDTWHADIRTHTDQYLRYLYDQPERPSETWIFADWEEDQTRKFHRWHKCTYRPITLPNID